MMECLYPEKVITGAIVCNVSIGLLVIILALVLLYFLHIKHYSEQNIDSIGVSLRNMAKAATFSMYPIIIILVFADSCGMKKEEVIKEYEKDSMERRNVIYTLLGQRNFSKKFIERYPSQFMLNGYEGEEILLKKIKNGTK
ncbi:unnamed protein product [Bursaphelenchus xylophilus]|uniref:(pine wood nematode) hypothetical protein n=1 Tax=Bursaphelenchus xylophilus TaxID=6326 RepID=A0A1I7SF65_BURXY|nr:unnamed protein product [Bursaphelenchus xylophilus]CAG9130505.1 unnamed protein product [Bursaphelenchus xylophilus]